MLACINFSYPNKSNIERWSQKKKSIKQNDLKQKKSQLKG
jgi:hypothetical protein